VEVSPRASAPDDGADEHIGLFNTRAPGFAEEALRQGRLVAASYAEDDTLDFFE
jgi:hypothetical protein